MAKMPFIPDPRYAHDEDEKYEAQQRMKEDVSTTFRAPYPQEHEIGLPRQKLMGNQISSKQKAILIWDSFLFFCS